MTINNHLKPIEPELKHISMALANVIEFSTQAAREELKAFLELYAEVYPSAYSFIRCDNQFLRSLLDVMEACTKANIKRNGE